MAENSKIQWTHHTFNPWIGCAKVHTGCASCYAEALMADRYHRVEWGKDGTRVRTKTWGDPIRWNKQAEAAGERHRVFCASLADVFEQRAELAPWRADLFRLIDMTSHLDWLLLTKRPENVEAMWHTQVMLCRDEKGRQVYHGQSVPTRQRFRRENVWLGTSISDQATAETFGPRLLRCRDLARVLFYSIEPIVGPVQLDANRLGVGPWHDEPWPAVDWVIVGGESKQGKAEPRVCDLSWVRSIVDQCRVAGVPCFVKQLGSVARCSHDAPDDDRLALRNMRDRHGGDPSEWPADLRVREFPDQREAV